MIETVDTKFFESRRPRLLGISYRLLGSRADADDAVQDTYIRWESADTELIENKDAWLTSVCTRRCIDMLRAGHRQRIDYVGAWLPEPVHPIDDKDAEADALLASSLKMAFLLLLERLKPKERAAYLLHEIFDHGYSESAAAIGISEQYCRKLVSRAKVNIGPASHRYTTPVKVQKRLLSAFTDAVTNGSTVHLEQLLTDKICLTADGGGKIPTIAIPLHGKASVLAFIANQLCQYWRNLEWHIETINGELGFRLRSIDTLIAAVSFGYDAHGRATHIFIIRNPEKLTHFQQSGTYAQSLS